MSKRRITIYDLAKELKISAATVSRALANDPRVKESTKIKILDLAKKWKYQPNQIATALRMGRSKILGVLIPTSKSSIFSPVVYGVEEIADRAGYNVLVGQSHESYEKEVSAIQTFIRARIDGILVSIARGTHDYDHFQNILQHDIPIVFFDRVTHELEASTIEIDDFAAAASAVEHLLAQGFRRIAHFAGPDHIRIYQNRLRGYQAALKNNGIEIREDFIRSSGIGLDDGKKLAKEMMGLSNPPDAFFSASDDAAIGAMQFLTEAGYQIPAEIGVVGFANKEFSPYVSPALSSVDQRLEEMGRKAADLILHEIKTNRTERTPQRIVIDTNLIVRSSSQRKI